MIIIKNKPFLPRVYVTLADFCYPVQAHWISCSQILISYLAASVPDEGYSRNVPDEGYYSNVPDEGYYSNVPDEGYYSNVPDEGYSRNASYTLN